MNVAQKAYTLRDALQWAVRTGACCLDDLIATGRHLLAACSRDPSSWAQIFTEKAAAIYRPA